MSEVPGEDDYTAEPHGDAGEPPRLVGVIGGMVAEKCDPILAAMLTAFDKRRAICLILALDMLSRDANADEFKTAALAIHFERYLVDGVDNQAKTPELKAVQGGKS